MPLTKSSTLALCVKRGAIQRVGDELIREYEACQCYIYGTDSFIEWRDQTLCHLEGSQASELSPDEEVDDFLRRLQLGKRATEIARMEPTKHGVWEIRLAQTRLFGWFPQPRALVLVSGEEIEFLKKGGRKLYNEHRDEVRNQRAQLGLNYVAGHQTKVLPPQTSP